METNSFAQLSNYPFLTVEKIPDEKEPELPTRRSKKKSQANATTKGKKTRIFKRGDEAL